MTVENKRIFRKMNFSELEYWYNMEFKEAFAENERKPFQDIIKLIEEKRYEVFGFFEGNRLIGYASLWMAQDVPLVLLDYLGVSAALRNGGIGADILEHLKALGTPIVTESELPVEGDCEKENSIRVRRINFYKRNGFVPAYEMATCGMRWQALLINADEFLMESVMKWHKSLYGTEYTIAIHGTVNEIGLLFFYCSKLKRKDSNNEKHRRKDLSGKSQQYTRNDLLTKPFHSV